LKICNLANPARSPLPFLKRIFSEDQEEKRRRGEVGRDLAKRHFFCTKRRKLLKYPFSLFFKIFIITERKPLPRQQNQPLLPNFLKKVLHKKNVTDSQSDIKLLIQEIKMQYLETVNPLDKLNSNICMST
jgi:hypothetical protein